MPVITQLQMKMTDARHCGDHVESTLEKFCKEVSSFCRPKSNGFKPTVEIIRKNNISSSCK